ncbi:hypothetical protein K1719_016727 [Acacia pycnantha]|nr:hypothetical protein K1719_016727 [Acacia pycnantha]
MSMKSLILMALVLLLVTTMVQQITSNGLLQLTNETKLRTGHAFYPNPILLTNSCSFSTTFVFAVRSAYQSSSGHGVAFVISPTKAFPVQVWVDYDARKKQIDVTLAPINIINKPETPLVRLSQDLSHIIKNHSYVGFSASTGSLLTSLTSHYVLGWSFRLNGEAQNFQFSKLPKLPRFGGKKQYRKWKFYEIVEQWEENYGPHRFKYKDLYIATKGFGDSELLGSGGFGKVYKGTMPGSNIEVAVKKVWHGSRQGMKEFIAEIVSIGRLRHRNLASLLGYCRRKDELLLVYDFIPNGSLDKYLFNQPSVTLNWMQRFRIIKGVASGLCYLHEEWEQVVVHRDIKASNVLLDSEFNGKLGDFGLARLYDHGSDPATTHVVGTFGYLAPEYVRTRRATTKSDVFAFGVFMLEVVCGRRPTDLAVDRPSMHQVVQYLIRDVPLRDFSSLISAPPFSVFAIGSDREFDAYFSSTTIQDSILSGGR